MQPILKQTTEQKCRVGRKSSKYQVAKIPERSQQVVELITPLRSMLVLLKTTSKCLIQSPAQHDAERPKFALKEFR